MGVSGALPVDLFSPNRRRPEVEWSVALSHEGAALDRWVRYGLSDEAIRAFVRGRGGHPESLFEMLEKTYGPPAQLACGQDGAKAKLYWFLDGDDPYFIGVDLRTDCPPALKWYRGLEPHDSATAMEVLPEALHAPLEWLLERLERAAAERFHLVLLSREVPPRYTGVHVGIAPDWAGLLDNDTTLLRTNVAEELCDFVGLRLPFEAARERIFGSPMAWTAYFSLLLREDGSPGVNIYTRATPVCEVEGSLALVEPGRGGVVARPAVVTFGLHIWPDLEVRLRTWGDGQHFLRLGPWQLDYGLREGSGEASPNEARLQVLEETARYAVEELGPREMVRVVERLRLRPEVSHVELGPDMRFHEGDFFSR